MLEALELINQKTDNEAMGAKVSGVMVIIMRRTSEFVSTDGDLGWIDRETSRGKCRYDQGEYIGKVESADGWTKRRFKAAFEAYLEREMPRIRDEVSGV